MDPAFGLESYSLSILDSNQAPAYRSEHLCEVLRYSRRL